MYQPREIQPKFTVDLGCTLPNGLHRPKSLIRSAYSEKETAMDKGARHLDDYAKDGGPGEVWLLRSFYHDPLNFLIVKEVQ